MVPSHNFKPGTSNRVLGMFAKWPEAGKAKTRLAAQIGATNALRIAHAMLGDSLARFANPNTESILCFTPANQKEAFQTISNNQWQLREQSQGDLGQRLSHYFQGYRGKLALAIGSDSPSLPTNFIEAAFQELEKHDLVVGPSSDGGFYLLGLKDYPKHLLDNIEWGTEKVLGQLLQNAKLLKLSTNILPEWHDIDTQEDLDKLKPYKDLFHCQKALQQLTNYDS